MKWIINLCLLLTINACIKIDNTNSDSTSNLRQIQTDSLAFLDCNKLLESLRKEKLDTIKHSPSIPTNLENALIQLDTLINNKFKRWIKCLPDQEFSVYTHHNLGAYLRNTWQLWGNSLLVEDFNRMDIFHPDDMSAIILDSYQRKVKEQDIKLEQQIREYKEFWEKKTNTN